MVKRSNPRGVDARFDDDALCVKKSRKSSAHPVVVTQPIPWRCVPTDASPALLLALPDAAVRRLLVFCRLPMLYSLQMALPAHRTLIARHIRTAHPRIAYEHQARAACLAHLPYRHVGCRACANHALIQERFATARFDVSLKDLHRLPAILIDVPSYINTTTIYTTTNTHYAVSDVRFVERVVGERNRLERERSVEGGAEGVAWLQAQPAPRQE